MVKEEEEKGKWAAWWNEEEKGKRERGRRRKVWECFELVFKWEKEKNAENDVFGVFCKIHQRMTRHDVSISWLGWVDENEVTLALPVQTMNMKNEDKKEKVEMPLKSSFFLPFLSLSFLFCWIKSD